MEDNTISTFQQSLHNDLYEYLLSIHAIDRHLPECPDIEDKFRAILEEYLHDGVREYNKYPVTSLGWMMFMGMAMAWMWDKDWANYSLQENYYQPLRDIAGYDDFDQTVLEILGYTGNKAEQITQRVARCAQRVFSTLNRADVEPGTQQAFNLYVAALRQLYNFGIAVELNALGYHMVPYTGPVSPN